MAVGLRKAGTETGFSEHQLPPAGLEQRHRYYRSYYHWQQSPPLRPVNARAIERRLAVGGWDLGAISHNNCGRGQYAHAAGQAFLNEKH